jgi:aerobic-type carbon monoxide dehydrogenase small subunit (CoxS/CutS family)
MRDDRITLQVNGQDHRTAGAAGRLLLHVLREDLGLMGAREACGIGVCGTCTVLVDGRAMSSCLMLAAQVEGRRITTIEGLADGEALHPVQQAYLDHFAFQCAYCTPGFILSTVAMLEEDPSIEDQAIRGYLAGNLCRCGSYLNILRAVRAVRDSHPGAG